MGKKQAEIQLIASGQNANLKNGPKAGWALSTNLKGEDWRIS